MAKLNMYKNISKSKLKVLFRNAQVFIQNCSAEYDENTMIIQSFYNPSNAIAGTTDYKDHRQDSLGKVKRMIRQCIETRQCQNGSYYNSEGKPFDQVRVVLGYGGWTAYPHWSDGSMDFFAASRVNMKRQK
jgi:hypothetical protein